MTTPWLSLMLRTGALAVLFGSLTLVGCDSAHVANTETTADALTADARADGDGIPDQYIVVFGAGVADAPGLANRLVQAEGGTLLHTYEHALKGFAFRGSAQAAAALERNPNVAYVEQDQRVYAVGGGTQSNATWGLDRSDQRALPLDQSYTYTTSASNVHAYILDTGIRYTHQDFGERVSTTEYYDAFGGNGNDGNGHGTHVAGTVGGTAYGIAKGVQLFAVRVLDNQGSGTMGGVVAGVDWVTARKQANPAQPMVANMSLGGGASTALDDAVRNSIAAGVSYAVAAGNGDRLGRQQPACNYSPARVREALTVGATTNTDAKTSWSNYGECVDLFAPGASITSAWHTSNTATNTISGTSMAAPHVAGVVALYLADNPGASPMQVFQAVYDNTTKGIVTNSSTANNHLLYSIFGDSESDPEDPTDPKDPTDPEDPKEPTEPADPSEITLEADGYKVQGRWRTDLSWSPSGTPDQVDVFRDGSRIATVNNSGSHTDATNFRGGGSLTYKVCEAGTNTCSSEVTVHF